MIDESNCPTADQIRNLLDNRLSPLQAGEFLKHVDRCPRCQQQIEQLDDVSDAVPGAASVDGVEPRRTVRAADSMDYGPAFHRAFAVLYAGPNTEPASEKQVEDARLERQLGKYADHSNPGRLGPYELRTVVGQGGMGIVFRVRDTVLNRDAALKILAPQMADRLTARQRFSREAQAAAAITHDNVLSIHTVAEAGGLPYLVMPYVAGGSLAEKLERQPQSPIFEVLRIGRQMALGLAAAHERGLVHRDIKPSNVLLEGPEERVKIADFGLASALDSASHSHTNVVPGTPEFMSPEQAQGLPVDARSDLFSLGVVLYLMCTGQSPFRTATPLASIRRVCDFVPPLVTELNPDATAWLAATIARLLQKDPAGRYATATEVAETLGYQLAMLGKPRRPAPHPVELYLPPSFEPSHELSEPIAAEVAASPPPFAVAPASKPVLERSAEDATGARQPMEGSQVADPLSMGWPIRPVAIATLAMNRTAPRQGGWGSFAIRSSGLLALVAAAFLVAFSSHGKSESSRYQAPQAEHSRAANPANGGRHISVSAEQLKSTVTQPVYTSARQKLVVQPVSFRPATASTSLAAPQKKFVVDVDPVLNITALEPPAGPAGTMITVRGHGLADTNKVTFYARNTSKEAEFLVVSDVKLKVIAPEWLREGTVALIVVETARGLTVTVPSNAVSVEKPDQRPSDEAGDPLYVTRNGAPFVIARLQTETQSDGDERFFVIRSGGLRRAAQGAALIERGGILMSSTSTPACQPSRHGPYFVRAGGVCTVGVPQTVYYEPGAQLGADMGRRVRLVAVPRITASAVEPFRYTAFPSSDLTPSSQPPLITAIEPLKPSPGDVVLVRGHGLASAAAVELFLPKLNTHFPAGFRAIDDNQLRLEVPEEVESPSGYNISVMITLLTPRGATFTAGRNQVATIDVPKRGGVKSGHLAWVTSSGVFDMSEAVPAYIEPGGIVANGKPSFVLFAKRGSTIFDSLNAKGWLVHEPGAIFEARPVHENGQTIEVPVIQPSLLDAPLTVVGL